MELTETELECIKYFPDEYEDLTIRLFTFFVENLLKITKIPKTQFENNTREDYRTHDVMKNETIKKAGKDFLTNDFERFMKFSVMFMNGIGYEIYVNKDNCGENRLHLISDYYHNEIMISDSQTEILVNPENYNELKENLSIYMNLYKRFEIFKNSVECFLKAALEEYGYWGYFLTEMKVQSYEAANRSGQIYVYGKPDLETSENFEDKLKKILIPFDNFVPVLNEIIEDVKNETVQTNILKNS